MLFVGMPDADVVGMSCAKQLVDAHVRDYTDVSRRPVSKAAASAQACNVPPGSAAQSHHWLRRDPMAQRRRG